MGKQSLFPAADAAARSGSTNTHLFVLLSPEKAKNTPVVLPNLRPLPRANLHIWLLLTHAVKVFMLIFIAVKISLILTSAKLTRSLTIRSCCGSSSVKLRIDVSVEVFI